MNKYQEALDEIKGKKLKQGNYTILDFGYVLEKEIEILQELIDRAKPEKVLSNGYVNLCPVCKNSVWQIKEESKYCFRCGKALEYKDGE